MRRHSSFLFQLTVRILYSYFPTYLPTNCDYINGRETTLRCISSSRVQKIVVNEAVKKTVWERVAGILTHCEVICLIGWVDKGCLSRTQESLQGCRVIERVQTEACRRALRYKDTPRPIISQLEHLLIVDVVPYALASSGRETGGRRVLSCPIPYACINFQLYSLVFTNHFLPSVSNPKGAGLWNSSTVFSIRLFFIFYFSLLLTRLYTETFISVFIFVRYSNSVSFNCFHAAVINSKFTVQGHQRIDKIVVMISWITSWPQFLLWHSRPARRWKKKRSKWYHLLRFFFHIIFFFYYFFLSLIFCLN